MKNLCRFGLIILVISAVMGCAGKMTTGETDAINKEEKLYEVIVKDVGMDYSNSAQAIPVIVLANKDDDKQVLPIWVGMSEGISVSMALKKQVPPRPGSHDLFASVLGNFDMKLTKVVITDLRDNTYIAVLTIAESHGRTKEIDARPSDAIALALRCVSPIFISEKVISKNGWIEMPKQSENKIETLEDDDML